MGVRGVTSTFWTEGNRTPTFQDENVKNLLLSGVNRDDLRRLNYYKTVFGHGSAPDPAGRTHDALSDRILPILSPHFGTKGASFSF